MRQAVYTLNAIRADVEYGAYSWACFKAQQAAELALKALLKALGKPAFGHNLVQFFKELAEYCGGADSELALCIGYLDKLYPSDAQTHSSKGRPTRDLRRRRQKWRQSAPREGGLRSKMEGVVAERAPMPKPTGEQREIKQQTEEVCLEYPGGVISLGGYAVVGRRDFSGLPERLLELIDERHFAVYFKDGVWWVEDLGSRRGTYLNGVRAKRERLREGDVVSPGAAVAVCLSCVEQRGELRRWKRRRGKDVLSFAYVRERFTVGGGSTRRQVKSWARETKVNDLLPALLRRRLWAASWR